MERSGKQQRFARFVAQQSIMNTATSILFALAFASPIFAQAPATAPAEPAATNADEAPFLTHHTQLTSRDMFVKSGESYFSPDGNWIIFQATAAPAKGQEPEPFYAMYVAHLDKGGEGQPMGLSQITRISPEHSANTCGWFSPADRTAVLFGSTLVKPVEKEKSGFQVGSRKYVWAFPDEMDVVTARPFADDGKGGLKAITPTDVKPLFTRPNYDAECSYSPDGRFVLYSHIEDAPKPAASDAHHSADANIYIYDTKTGKQHAIVLAPGYDGGPFFSPDGRSICYRSDRAGNDLLQLYIADLTFEKDADGTPIPVGIEHEYQLTKNENVNWCPYWHPSGNYLIYGTSEFSNANYEVFAIEVDRARLAKLAARAKPGETIDASDARHARITKVAGADVLPVFSPDGKFMMWTAQRGPKADGETKPSSQVWIANVNGDPFTTPGTPRTP